jgi:hypothetical protein
MIISTLLWLLAAVTIQTSESLLTCHIFPDDSVFNTAIDTLPVDPDSDTYVSFIGNTTRLHPDFGSGTWAGQPIGIPYNIVSNLTVTQKVKFQYTSESDNVRYPIPTTPNIEAPTDRHVLMINKDSCVLFELFNAQRTKVGARLYQRGFNWTAGSGAVFDLKSNQLRPSGWTSADAAGLPIYPLLVRRSEVEAGVINHALRFTAQITRNEYIWPARHKASSNSNSNAPPLGQRFRLKASFDISAFSTDTGVILTALKRYGMFLADNGSNWYISGDPNSKWNNDVLVNEFHTKLKGSDFEAVDESGLMVSVDSGQVKASA